MKKSKSKRSILFSGIISFTLSALGFSSCDSLNDPNGEGPIICMYGVPSAKFVVTGNVVSEETNASLRDLQVTLITRETWTDGMGNYYESHPDTLKPAKTAANGSFHFEFGGAPGSKKYIYLIEDVDGAANGHYLTKKDSITFTKHSFKNGDGSWYSGEAEDKIGTIKVKPDKGK